MRSDGVLVPFAEYVRRGDTGEWLNAFPDFGDRFTPWFLLDGPAPTAWQFWAATGAPRSITTGETVKVQSHCQQVWGLATNAPGTPLAPAEVARPAGLALSGPAALEPLERLAADSAAGRRLRAFLTPGFDDAEEKALLDSARQPPPRSRFPALAARVARPIVVEALWRTRSRVNGYAVLYFEMAREYPRPPFGPQRVCNPVSVSSGWVVENDRGGLSAVDRTLVITDCHRMGFARSAPWGVVILDRRTYLFMFERYYEGEGYRIVQLDGPNVRRVLHAYGGGC
jgi:hypothetical protein